MSCLEMQVYHKLQIIHPCALHITLDLKMEGGIYWNTQSPLPSLHNVLHTGCHCHDFLEEWQLLWSCTTGN